MGKNTQRCIDVYPLIYKAALNVGVPEMYQTDELNQLIYKAAIKQQTREELQ
mgnify:FL=1|jgi:hypothetical protein